VAIAGGLGLVYGVDWPTRNAFFPLLIGREQMMSAVALNAMVWQGTRIVAPALGGVLIAFAGTPVVFALSAAGAFGMFVVMLSLPVPHAVGGRGNVVRELREGLAFIFTRRLFLALLGLTYATMFFGMQYVQLMPLMAKAFEVEASELGLLFTAVGVGAVCGTFVTLRFQRSRRLGWMLLAAVFGTSLFVIGFAAAPVYLVGVALLFSAALWQSVFSISTMTALQLRVPDHLRGRVMGIHTITFSLIPLGGLLGGAIADVANVRVALAASAAVLAGIAALVALTQREVRELDGTATP
jgi:predicted MFS family arabinose efflux permease